MTIAGAGTGVTGGRVAQGGWIVGLERFTRLEISAGRAIAGAGVLLGDLHRAASATGQFYPPDPTETAAAVGGTIATNASGSRSFRYGDTRRYVVALRAVFMDGSIRELRRGQPVDFDVAAVRLPDTSKHSAGYRLAPGMDWVDLLVGSEGTLAVVTEADLALLPAPAAIAAGVVFFDAEDAALDAIDAWRGIAGLRMMEFFDRGSLVLLRSRYPEIPSTSEAALLIEQETAEQAGGEVDAWLTRLASARAQTEACWFAVSEGDRERFRRFRHALPEMVNDTVRRNGFMKLNTDFAVPFARHREMFAYYRRRLDREFPRQSVIFGHIGDAHLHVNVLPHSEDDASRASALVVEFARQAAALGGTVGAEHGLGKRKAHLLGVQYSGAEIAAMAAVKRRLDPEWLLGRGTLLPAPGLTAP